jgi:serine/threonine protein kinase
MAELLNYSKYFLKGQGSYSCTYGSSNPEDPLVQIKDNETAIKNQEQIQALGFGVFNTSHKYTIYPNNNIRNLRDNNKRTLLSKKDKIGRKCELTNNEKNPFKLVTIPRGGEDLSKLEVPPEDIYDFFTAFINIFEGLIILHDNHIAHLDVKPANIVAEKNSDGSYNIRLIDFGWSRKTDTNNVGKMFYDQGVFMNYPYWAYDLRLIDLNQFNTHIGYVSTDTPEIITALITEDIRYYNSELKKYNFPISDSKTLNPQLVYILMKKIPQNVPTVLVNSDVFALGLTLYNIWHRIIGYKLVSIEPVKGVCRYADTFICKIPYLKTRFEEITNNIYTLVLKMCNPDPFTRITMEDAKEEFRTIIEAIPKKYHMISYTFPPNNTTSQRPKERPWYMGLFNTMAGRPREVNINEGGSRRRRKTTRRNNKKYAKAKKTRASTK